VDASGDFAGFDAWLGEGKAPSPLDAARPRAAVVLGTHNLDAAMLTPQVDRRLREAVGLYKTTRAERVPTLLLPRVSVVPRRYRKGVRWHSTSDGVPRHSALTQEVQAAILLACCGVTRAVGLVEVSLLLMLSLLLWTAGEAHARGQFWNRVLDAIDGQIEGEELGDAVARRLSPAQASGMNVCVPSYVGDAYRRKIGDALNKAAADASQAN